MTRNIRVGIDIGSYEIKVAICEALPNHAEKSFPRVLGLGSSESKGLRHGYIVNPNDVVKSLGSAIRQAEKNAGLKIKKAYLALGGVGLQSVISSGSMMISRADSEVSDLDVSKAISNSEQEIPKHISINRKIIHTIPLQYRVDGKIVYGRPHGMKAMKLDVKTLFITCLEQHINDLIQCVEELNVEVEDVIASPIAGSLVTLSKVEKVAGCILANIGGETVSVIVFENSIPVSLEVFPIGSNDITNDIALGLKVAIDEAENIKHHANDSTQYSKRKIDEIIEARLTDIFELIESHLKKLSRNGLLPAGIIFIGGGALESNIIELAKRELRLPSKIASIDIKGNIKSPIKSPIWTVAYGLCLVGFTNEEESGMGIKRGLKLARTTTKGLLAWVKQFLP